MFQEITLPTEVVISEYKCQAVIFYNDGTRELIRNEGNVCPAFNFCKNASFIETLKNMHCAPVHQQILYAIFTLLFIVLIILLFMFCCALMFKFLNSRLVWTHIWMNGFIIAFAFAPRLVFGAQIFFNVPSEMCVEGNGGKLICSVKNETVFETRPNEDSELAFYSKN